MNLKDAYRPTKGVKTDLNNLLEKFSERQTVRYQQFAEVWRSMKFSYLGAGRKSEGECREFFEEVNDIALSFYLPPYNFQVRVGGLYILYGLYITQSCVPKVPIRVTYDQWKHILTFQENAHKQKHLDVEYIFQKLFCQNAFQFVATPHQVYIKAKDRNRHEKTGDTESDLNNKLKDVAVSVSKVFTPEILQQLQAIHAQYQHLKLGIAGPDAVRPDRSLDVVEDEIITNIDETLVQHRQKLEKIRNAQKGRHARYKQEDSESEDVMDAEDPDYVPVPTKSAQARVKAQAYTHKAKQSKSRRHRNVITQDLSASSPEKVSRRAEKKRKRKKGQDTVDTQEEENKETFLSSSVEESSEQVISPSTGNEYLSMPTLDVTGLHHTEVPKSKKNPGRTKIKTQTQTAPVSSPSPTKQTSLTSTSTSLSVKRKSNKSKSPKTSTTEDTDNPEDGSSGGSVRKPSLKKAKVSCLKSKTKAKFGPPDHNPPHTKAKTKSKASPPRPKSKAKVDDKVSPVKNVGITLKGKRKQSTESVVSPEKSLTKIKKLSQKAAEPGPCESKVKITVKGKRKQSFEGEVSPETTKVKTILQKAAEPDPSESKVKITVKGKRKQGEVILEEPEAKVMKAAEPGRCKPSPTTSPQFKTTPSKLNITHTGSDDLSPLDLTTPKKSGPSVTPTNMKIVYKPL